jgi:hypothetical protein
MSHWLTRYDPDDGEPYGTVCRCALNRDHDGSEAQDADVHAMPDGPVTDAVEALAVLFSVRRTHGSVFMDGSHNPLPGEMLDARRFIEGMMENGWRPDGKRLAALLDHALDFVEGQCCPDPLADAFVARTRSALGMAT